MSILDFPRETLPLDLWVYDKSGKESLPTLSPVLRETVLREATRHLRPFDLKLDGTNFYGGSASYQWSPGADIDVSVYTTWPENVTPEAIEKVQDYFKDISIPFRGHEIHFFLKGPEDQHEVADAIYDIYNDEWILPPLILPKGFDPEEYFAPFVKTAENKAKKLDAEIGELGRELTILKKAAEAYDQARDPSAVKDRIEAQRAKVKHIIEHLASTFLSTREARYAMHDQLRQKFGGGDYSAGRFERFQAPEVIWKYLDRAGYIDCLWHLYSLVKNGGLEESLDKLTNIPVSLNDERR